MHMYNLSTVAKYVCNYVVYDCRFDVVVIWKMMNLLLFFAGPHVGVIIGCIVGAVILLIGGVGGIIIVYKYRKKKKNSGTYLAMYVHM